MNHKMLNMTVYLEPGQQERLRDLRNHTRVPMGVYVREGIDLLLDRARAAGLLPPDPGLPLPPGKPRPGA